MCVLHISSSRNSFTAFLAETRLPVYKSHDKGDMKSGRKGTAHDDYGFSCDVSGREWTDASGQIEDAIRFLKVHSEDLHSLMALHRIDDMRLDFPFDSRLSRAVVAQFDYLPPDLIRLCAQHGIGIEISHYAVHGGSREPDAAPDGSSAVQLGKSNGLKRPHQ